MAQQTRTTLKGYFETGDVPTQAQFENLIDSTPNITDDGIIPEEKWYTLDNITFTGDGTYGTPLLTADSGKYFMVTGFNVILKSYTGINNGYFDSVVMNITGLGNISRCQNIVGGFRTFEPEAFSNLYTYGTLIDLNSSVYVSITGWPVSGLTNATYKIYIKGIKYTV